MLEFNQSTFLNILHKKGWIFLASALLSVFYNTALTVVLTLAACCVFFLYHHHRRPLLIALCTMFAVYLLDNSIVFCTEIIPDFAAVYDRMFLETPSIKTVYFVTLVGSLLFALHCVIPAFTLKQMALLIFVYTALLICVPMITRHDWMVFLYYFTTQLLVIGISGWGLVALRKTESSFDRGMLKRIFLYFLCMSILVLAEDSFVIFFLDRLSGPRVKINNRNFSENLLYLGLSWPVFRYTAGQLKHLSSVVQTPGEQTSEPEPNRERMDFYAFCSAYNLTEREREILTRLLQSRSQQEISDELIIALGTVKTHIHNIYQKTDSSNRNQIIAKYKEFCNLHHGESSSLRT